MRFVLSFVFVALLAGPAVAGGGSCLPTCEVLSHLLAFVPPVTEVERGSSVEWSSLDIGHTASDQFGSGPPTIGSCFNTDFTPASPGAAYFTIEDGKLYAISETAGGELVECEHATPLPDGSFVVDYICAFHNRMVGKLWIR